MGPAGLFPVGNLPGHPGGRGALPAGVGENVHLGKGAGLEKGQRLGKLPLRLPRKAHNQVRGEGGPVKMPAQQLHRLQVALGGVPPLHAGQGGVAAALQGQVKVGT